MIGGPDRRGSRATRLLLALAVLFAIPGTFALSAAGAVAQFEEEERRRTIRTVERLAAGPEASNGLRAVLMYHEGSRLDQDGLSRWLASFSEVCGIVVIRERRQARRARIRRELRRVGLPRFFDVAAMRLFYRAFIARRDRRVEDDALEQLHKRYPDLRREPPTLITEDPNSAAVADFIRERAPDFTLARCKTLLRQEVFDAPRLGTFVMHPGICPEYRNSHGCFWALANDDYDHVGMSLVRIDEGIDTGPVYGYYSYPYDAKHESHILIQQRVILENLDAIRDRLLDVAAGKATPLDTTGRPSATWGQPWLTKYVRIRWKARRRA